MAWLAVTPSRGAAARVRLLGLAAILAARPSWPSCGAVYPLAHRSTSSERVVGVTKAAGPKVSVLMSVYDDERHVGAAIESILNQTYRLFEFLIIDDGSSDGSRDIIEAFDDERIRLIS